MKLAIFYTKGYPLIDRIENEISQGLLSLHRLLSSWDPKSKGYLGQSSPNSDYLCAAAAAAHSYAVKGMWNSQAGIGKNTDSRDQELKDMITFCHTARAAIELHGSETTDIEADVPIELEVLLYTLFARSKIDLKNGLSVYDFSSYGSWFEYEETDKLSISEISMLAGMSEMAVRNATRSTGGDRLETFKINNRVFSEIETANNWLIKRLNFKPTQLTQEIPESQILVPFAKDGTYFCGNCKRKAGFQIGPKGDEKYYLDIYEALSALKKMETAKWRRPNANGIPGIVSVSEWKPISRADFEAAS